MAVVEVTVVMEVVMEVVAGRVMAVLEVDWAGSEEETVADRTAMVVVLESVVVWASRACE